MRPLSSHHISARPDARPARVLETGQLRIWERPLDADTVAHLGVGGSELPMAGTARTTRTAHTVRAVNGVADGIPDVVRFTPGR
ncbi:hypothetical protein GCM10011579_077940 [Streptomyces albiflavescens]|uniref:Uncharacterized protein n=1 Tax=Streptomyces albiflavescens TaxID=1623582 RepID=A0A917YDV1_9ACTN|nr:hypothetical protein GCM10011579_077940 [Streptomyces albiflavescens]